VLRRKEQYGGTIAKEVTAPELALLFCVVTGTEWAKAGITVEAVRAVAIKVSSNAIVRRGSRLQSKGAPCSACNISIAASVALSALCE
jgi:hypothetical protein